MTQQVDKTRKLGLVNEQAPLVDEMAVFELGTDGEEVGAALPNEHLSIKLPLLGLNVHLQP